MTAALRIATRESALALWQARHVAGLVADIAPGMRVELVPMTTSGDRMLEVSLAKVGGKGLFLKELELALQDGRADIAVHSMKDVPAELAPGMSLPAVLPRADPRDALVSGRYDGLAALPQGARLGTSSLRRQCQLKSLRPDLAVTPLRGNVQTRLAKLERGDYDAIVLARAGLDRLGLAERARCCLPVDQCLPAIGQGIIGIESTSDNDAVRSLCAQLDDARSRACITAERALNAGLEGSCHSPIAGYAELHGDTLWLRGVVGLPDGSRLIRGEQRGAVGEAASIGHALARDMIARGAADLLAALD